MKTVFLLATIGLLLESGASPLTSAAGRAARQPDVAERPLLHLDFTANAQSPEIVTAATTADGRRLRSFALADARSAVWSPDGTQFVALAASAKAAGGSLKILRLNGQADTVFEAAADEGLTGWAPAWSPDGTCVAVTTMKRSAVQANGLEYFAVIVDVGKKAVRSRLPIPEGAIKLPRHLSPSDKFRFSPNGRHILISWERAVVLDLDQGPSIAISDRPVVAEWTARGDGVLYFETATGSRPPTFGGLYIKNLASGERTEVANAKTLAARGMAPHSGMHSGRLVMSPSNSKLAIVQAIPESQRSTLRVFDVTAGAALDLAKPVKTSDVDDIIVKLEWSGDERSLAAVMIPRTAVFPQGPFGRPAIRILQLASDDWRTVAMINFDLRQDWPQSLELLGNEKVLSWTGGSRPVVEAMLEHDVPPTAYDERSTMQMGPFVQTATAARVPMGVEYAPSDFGVSGGAVFRLPPSLIPSPSTVGATLKVILGQLPAYEMATHDGVISVAPSALLHAPRHFLNRPLEKFEVRNLSLYEAVWRLRRAIDPTYPPFAPISREAWLQQPVTLVAEYVTPRTILNRLVAQHGAAIWLVTYQGSDSPVLPSESTCVIRLTPFLGEGSGVGLGRYSR